MGAEEEGDCHPHENDGDRNGDDERPENADSRDGCEQYAYDCDDSRFGVSKHALFGERCTDGATDTQYARSCARSAAAGAAETHGITIDTASAAIALTLPATI